MKSIAIMGASGHCKVIAEIALQNAEKLLTLNEREKDMIQNHMFPMTFAFPRYAETYLITLVDKYCAVMEFMLPQPKRFRNFLRRKTQQQAKTV